MSIEVATYIADLQPVNPPSTDPTSQGDDHLRLIKQVLQNSLTGSSRAFNIPGAKAVTGPYSVLKADGESILYVSTAGGAATITLPSLTSADAGWKVWFVKTTSDANPMYITPASGTINSGGIAALSRARRCIPGIQTATIWDGANWFITRAGSAPIGSVIEFWGTTLPAGFEWPNGQTLASVATNYPEYNAKIGSGATPDLRGFTTIALDNLGGAAAGRLPNGFISGSTLGATGGADGAIITTTQMPSHQHAVFLKENAHSHVLPGTWVPGGAGGQGGAGAGVGVGVSSPATSSVSTGMTIGSVSGVANDNQTAGTGGGTIRGNLQPSVMMGKILVVE